ncbi:MAG: YegS/Rv2252/BmrU family lipid kinase [Halanaerobiaceae bacterium]
MNKLLLVYNPVAGSGSFPDHLDDFIAMFQDYYQINICRTPVEGLKKRFARIKREDYKALIIAGGDGTVNRIVNAMLANNINLPLGIIPAGTINDFASYLNMPVDIQKSFPVFLQDNFRKVDVGKVNNRYFINVCAGGILTGVPHRTATFLKNRLGKAAYFIRGIKELTDFQSLKLKVTIDGEEFTEDFFLFLLLNSRNTGGFKNITEEAKIDDGLLDFIAIRGNKIYDVYNSLLNVFIYNRLDSDGIIYRQGRQFILEEVNNDQKNYSDIDGEKGPAFPLKITVKEKALTVFAN